MKKIIFFSLAALIFLSCSQNEPKFPQGAWKQCGFEYYKDGKLAGKEVIKYYSIKMFSENKFAFVHKISSDSTISYEYGSGSYVLNGKDYIETIETHSIKYYEGVTLNMTLELINDTLFQTWIPIDSLGKPISNVKVCEMSVRL